MIFSTASADSRLTLAMKCWRVAQLFRAATNPIHPAGQHSGCGARLNPDLPHVPHTVLRLAPMIDGATRIEMLLRTVISLSIPGILSCKIFSVLLPTEWALLTGHEHATR